LRRSGFASPSYDRSLHENVILLPTWLLSCVVAQVLGLSTPESIPLPNFGREREELNL
jgi:hypothetical protein